MTPPRVSRPPLRPRPLRRRSLAGLVLGGALIAAALAVSPVQAQQADPQLIGRMQVRITELERLVEDLTGKVEEAMYANRALRTQLENQLGDIDYRLNALEGNPTPAPGAAPTYDLSGGATGAGAGGASASMGSLPGTIPGDSGSLGGSSTTGAAAATILPDAPAVEQYNFAFSLLRRADYAGAEQAFKAFLGRHPSHSLSGNAQYWLGETYYVRGDYEQAAVAFLSGYQSYPDSTKAPDNLLKLGLAMNNLGKTKEACAAFGRLGSQYPRAPEAIKRRASAESSRLGC